MSPPPRIQENRHARRPHLGPLGRPECTRAGGSALAGSIVPLRDLASAVAKARADYANALYKAGDWAKKKDWYGEAERIWDEVLVLDADHKKARKALGFTMDRKTDAWVRDDDWRPGRNEGRVAQSELEEREAEARSEYRDDLLAAVVAHGEGADVEEVRAILDPVARFFPEDAVLQQHMGRVEGWEGRPWVLPEAKVAKARRDELRKYGRELRDRAPASAAGEPTEEENGIGLDWTAAALGDWRCLTTAKRDEADDALRVAWSAGELFRHVLDPEAKLPAGLTLYTLDDFGERESIVKLPIVRPGDKEAIESVSSFWLDWHTLSVVDQEKTGRMDGVSRQCIAWLLKDRFGISSRHGWVFEGVGLYLSYRVVGTRLGIFVRESKYTSEGSPESLLARLRGSRSNWFRIAHEVLNSEYKPNFAFMLGKDVNNLTGEELMYGYVLSAYLLEVMPEKVPDVLKRIGAGNAPATVIEETFGAKLDEVERNLLNWLDDVRY